MNTKEWIKPYRDAIDQQYKLDDAAQQDVDFYFTKLEKYAAGFPDQGSFATQFLQSPLYQEYTNLFTKYQQMGITPSGETVEQATETLKRENREASMEEHIKSTAEREAEDSRDTDVAGRGERGPLERRSNFTGDWPNHSVG